MEDWGLGLRVLNILPAEVCGASVGPTRMPGSRGELSSWAAGICSGSEMGVTITCFSRFEVLESGARWLGVPDTDCMLSYHCSEQEKLRD